MGDSDIPSDFSHVALLEAARAAGCPALARMANYWGESGGVYELRNLLARLATMEAAVAAGKRVLDSLWRGGTTSLHSRALSAAEIKSMLEDTETVFAAAELLNGDHNESEEP